MILPLNSASLSLGQEDISHEIAFLSGRLKRLCFRLESKDRMVIAVSFRLWVSEAYMILPLAALAQESTTREVVFLSGRLKRLCFRLESKDRFDVTFCIHQGRQNAISIYDPSMRFAYRQILLRKTLPATLRS